MQSPSRAGVAIQSLDRHLGRSIIARVARPGENNETCVRSGLSFNGDGVAGQVLEGRDVFGLVLGGMSYQDVSRVAVGPAFDFHTVGDFVCFVHDRLAGRAVAGGDVAGFVGHYERGASRFIVPVPDQNYGSVFHDTSHALEDGWREQIERDYGDASLPQVFDDVAQGRRLLIGRDAVSPLMAVTRQGSRRRDGVAEIAYSGGGDSNRCVHCRG